jgi:hypothetical protein
MNSKQQFMIETYQCPGCTCGSDISCFEPGDNLECGKHVPGTFGNQGIGVFLLGMPTGFCRVKGKKQLRIFNDVAKNDPDHSWSYDKFNIPVWKFLDKHNNTIVRGMCPRIDFSWIHIYMGDRRNDINCFEIVQTDLDKMD